MRVKPSTILDVMAALLFVLFGLDLIEKVQYWAWMHWSGHVLTYVVVVVPMVVFILLVDISGKALNKKFDRTK